MSSSLPQVSQEQKVNNAVDLLSRTRSAEFWDKNVTNGYTILKPFTAIAWVFIKLARTVTFSDSPLIWSAHALNKTIAARFNIVPKGQQDDQVYKETEINHAIDSFYESFLGRVKELGVKGEDLPVYVKAVKKLVENTIDASDSTLATKTITKQKFQARETNMLNSKIIEKEIEAFAHQDLLQINPDVQAELVKVLCATFSGTTPLSINAAINGAIKKKHFSATDATELAAQKKVATDLAAEYGAALNDNAKYEGFKKEIEDKNKAIIAEQDPIWKRLAGFDVANNKCYLPGDNNNPGEVHAASVARAAAEKAMNDAATLLRDKLKAANNAAKNKSTAELAKASLGDTANVSADQVDLKAKIAAFEEADKAYVAKKEELDKIARWENNSPIINAGSFDEAHRNLARVDQLAQVKTAAYAAYYTRLATL